MVKSELIEVTIEILNPCEDPQLFMQPLPNRFRDMTYFLGRPAIQQAFAASKLAPLGTRADCGPILFEFLSIDENDNQNPLSQSLFSVSMPPEYLKVKFMVNHMADRSVNYDFIGDYYITYRLKAVNYPLTSLTQYGESFKVAILKLKPVRVAPKWFQELRRDIIVQVGDDFFFEMPPATSISFPDDYPAISVRLINRIKHFVDYD